LPATASHHNASTNWRRILRFHSLFSISQKATSFPDVAVQLCFLSHFEAARRQHLHGKIFEYDHLTTLSRFDVNISLFRILLLADFNSERNYAAPSRQHRRNVNFASHRLRKPSRAGMKFPYFIEIYYNGLPFPSFPKRTCYATPATARIFAVPYSSHFSELMNFDIFDTLIAKHRQVGKLFQCR